MSARHHVALDGWRGIAALMVAVFHFKSSASIQTTSFIQNSWLFVDFFFVLSGFVIAANYIDRLRNGFGTVRFMALRIGRLYPLHLVMLVAFVATEVALAVAGHLTGSSGREYFSGQTSPFALLTNLLLIQGWGFHNGVTWNGVAWSISTEMAAYAVFAILATVFPGRTRTAMLGVIAISLVFVLPPSIRPNGIAHFVELARCLYGFALGVLLNTLYLWIASGRSRDIASTSRHLFTLIEVLAGAGAIAFVTMATQLPAHLLAPLAFAPTVLVYAFDRGAISWLLQTRAVGLIGAMSYSIYMIHPFVQSRILLPVALVVQKLTGWHLVVRGNAALDGRFVWGSDPLSGSILSVLMIATVVAMSLITYRLIETPGRDAMRRLVDAFASRKFLPSETAAP